MCASYTQLGVSVTSSDDRSALSGHMSCGPCPGSEQECVNVRLTNLIGNVLWTDWSHCDRVNRLKVVMQYNRHIELAVKACCCTLLEGVSML